MRSYATFSKAKSLLFKNTNELSGVKCRTFRVLHAIKSWYEMPFEMQSFVVIYVPQKHYHLNGFEESTAIPLCLTVFLKNLGNDEIYQVFGDNNNYIITLVWNFLTVKLLRGIVSFESLNERNTIYGVWGKQRRAIVIILSQPARFAAQDRVFFKRIFICVGRFPQVRKCATKERFCATGRTFALRTNTNVTVIATVYTEKTKTTSRAVSMNGQKLSAVIPKWGPVFQNAPLPKTKFFPNELKRFEV